MRKIVLIILLYSVTFYTFANEQITQESTSINISYFGEFITHPGLKVSLEIPFYKKKGHHWYYTIKGGGYTHCMNHTSLFVGSEVGYRYIFRNGFELNSLLGVAYLHKFLGAEIYKVTDSGELEEVTHYGSPHIMPNVNIGFGYTFLKESQNPFTLFSKTEIFGEYPYNTYILPHIALSFGVRLKLK